MDGRRAAEYSEGGGVGEYAEEEKAALEHKARTRWTDELLNVTFVLTGVFSEDSGRAVQT